MNLSQAIERRRRGARAGTAALEFALHLPVALVLFLATFEAVTYLRTWYRIEQAAASAASAASRIEVLNRDAVAGVFEAARTVAAPHAAWSARSGPSARARTVVSVVTNRANANAIAWTCSRGDANLTPSVAGLTELPAGFAVPPGQSVLVVEIINTTSPWRLLSDASLFGTTGPSPMRAHAIVRSRGPEFATLTGGCP